MNDFSRFTINNQMETWNYRIWSNEFSGRSPDWRALRAAVFKHTVYIVNKQEYITDTLDLIRIIPDPEMMKGSFLYKSPKHLKEASGRQKVKVTVMNADCLEAAKLLKSAGLNPAVLNMANRHRPGGGVYGGAGAQEENLFRRSNLFLSLYQFSDLADKYGIARNQSNSYPLDRNTGGVYSPHVTVFRGTEHQGYCLLKYPYETAVISVPAINRPDHFKVDGEYRLSRSMQESTKEKIRTILRIAGLHNHDSLVLSAFGCGAFRNPPGHMAELFHQIFDKDEFKYSFKTIVFTIISDHNTGKEHNPEGNLLPFLREFG